MKKLLKILGWILLIATIIFFNDNFSVMAGALVILVIMNYGPGIFIVIIKKAKQFIVDSVKKNLMPTPKSKRR